MIAGTEAVILTQSCPYHNEHVQFERSLSEIREMLVRHGITKIMEVRETTSIVLDPTKSSVEAPVVVFGFVYQGRSFLMRFPITFMKMKEGPRLRMDISGRVIFYRVKNALLEVDIGISDLTQALCPYLALDVGGRPTPLHEALRDENALKQLPILGDL